MHYIYGRIFFMSFDDLLLRLSVYKTFFLLFIFFKEVHVHFCNWYIHPGNYERNLREIG